MRIKHRHIGGAVKIADRGYRLTGKQNGEFKESKINVIV
jgi:hypothetical protein